MTMVRVEFGVIEDARHVIYAGLDGLEPRAQARLANKLTAALREAGLLSQAVEQHYNLRQLCALVGRCEKHLKAELIAGRFGTVMRDDGGWLVPASGVQGWLVARVFSGSVRKEVAA